MYKNLIKNKIKWNEIALIKYIWQIEENDIIYNEIALDKSNKVKYNYWEQII